MRGRWIFLKIQRPNWGCVMLPLYPCILHIYVSFLVSGLNHSRLPSQTLRSWLLGPIIPYNFVWKGWNPNPKPQPSWKEIQKIKWYWNWFPISYVKPFTWWLSCPRSAPFESLLDLLHWDRTAQSPDVFDSTPNPRELSDAGWVMQVFTGKVVATN